MQCPVCKIPLVMSERQGIEVDYCPQCRGVWLDRGELDKIIERSTAIGTTYRSEPRDRDRYPDDDDRYVRHKRRKSWLEEIFD